MIWKKLKRMHHIGLIAIVLLVSLVLFLQFRNGEIVKIEGETSFDAVLSDEVEFFNEGNEVFGGNVVVDVKGAVKNPGLYELMEGSRVYDAVEMAGGLSDEADDQTINLAQLLHDEMLLYIPFRDGEGEVIQAKSDGKIALNRADQAELEQLPGIGPAKAAAIIAYRDEHGPFKEISELINVSGIGEKSFERLKELVSLY